MTIGKLADDTGIPASTIRYWEKVGVLPKAARVNGQRRYSEDAVHRIAVMQLAQSCGFRLEETRRLFTGFPTGVAASLRWQELAGRKRKELDEQIARLQAMRRMVDRVMKCRCLDLADCGRRAAAALSCPLN